MTTGRAVKGLTSAHAPRLRRALDGSRHGDRLRRTRPKVGKRLNVRIMSASLRRGHEKSERFRSLLTVLL